MIAKYTNESRPMFLTPEEWLEHWEHSVKDGRRAWAPATRDELLLAESIGLLANHPEWIPCAVGLRLLDLPYWFGRKQTALSPLWRERFIQTLLDDPDTLEAVRAIIFGGPSDECD